MKKTLSILLLCAGFSVVHNSNLYAKGAQPMKIAVVDVRRMLTQDPQLLKEDAAVSHEWRDLYNKLQATLDPAQKELTKLQKEYQDKIKELESLQKSGVSSQEALQKKAREELGPLEYKLQVQTQQIQNFSYAEMGKIQGILGPKIQKVTDDIVKKQGWDFAINRESVISTVSVGAGFNITSDVLSELNAQYTKDKAASKQKEATK